MACAEPSAAGGINSANAEAYARAGADILVTSAPYFAPPRDVAVTITAAWSAYAMKIAIATKEFTEVSGHAGQTRQWLVYDLSQHRAGRLLPAPHRVDLLKDQVLHVFEDDGPHPLDGIDLVVCASAGDGCDGSCHVEVCGMTRSVLSGAGRLARRDSSRSAK